METLAQKLEESAVTFKFSPTAILRFLRGRKGDPEKAFRGLVRHVQWRNEHDVDNITPEDFPSELEKNKIVVRGHDKSGRPLITVFARRHRTDLRDIDEMRKYIIYTLERAVENANPDEQKMTILFDLTGFGFFCMDYEVVKVLIDILQFNYPETLGVAMVVAAPMLFSACWLIIRPWLDPVTASKVLFLNHSQLTTHVDAAMIHPDIAKYT